MRIVCLTDHIHNIYAGLFPSHKRGGRLRWNQLWDAVEACPKNGISNIILRDQHRLPEPMVGMFVRGKSKLDDGDTAFIYINNDLGEWRETVLCKEMMHAWSAPDSRIGKSSKAELLFREIVQKGDLLGLSRQYQEDYVALLAAGDAMLPNKTIQRDIDCGLSIDQIASNHDLPVQLVQWLTKEHIMSRIQSSSV